MTSYDVIGFDLVKAMKRRNELNQERLLQAIKKERRKEKLKSFWKNFKYWKFRFYGKEEL